MISSKRLQKQIRVYKKLPQSEGCRQENKLRNILVLRDLGVPQKLLFSTLISNFQTVSGKERFEASLKKVLEMGFDPTTLNFVQALNTVYQLSDKTIEEKVSVLCTSLGFAVEAVWEIFKKHPTLLMASEKKILNSIELFLGLGFSRDEISMMVKCFPQCLLNSTGLVKTKIEFAVNQMNWPLKAVALFPQLLGYSMDRIVPRCNVIKALISKGLLGSEPPSIACVLAYTNEAYVMKHDDKQLVTELLAIFTKDSI